MEMEQILHVALTPGNYATWDSSGLCHLMLPVASVRVAKGGGAGACTVAILISTMLFITSDAVCHRACQNVIHHFIVTSYSAIVDIG